MLTTLEGIQFQQYQIQRLLNHGGMSTVYLATDKHSQQEVAIKMVHGSHVDNSERFQREIEIVRTLTHEHILPILDSGTYDDWYYMVMPYVEHGTLQERIERQLIMPDEAGAILEQIADALQYAHDKGIIHRDIKPTNVLLRNDNFVYLADFGVAKALDADNSLTRTGAMIGTPRYMAPELAFEPATTVSDVYSLGVLLYQILTGRVPFEGVTPLQTLQKHMQEQPLLPSLLNPAIPHPVEQVILCAMNKDPRLRFQTPREMAQAYNAALNTAPLAPMPPVQVVVRRISRRRRAPLALIATLVALVLLFSALLVFISLAHQSTHVAASTAPRIHITATAKPRITVTPPVQPTAHPTATPVRQVSTSSHEHNHKHGHGHK
ncbi:MAG: serine/threonine-protein kinase [Ktedonobacteraceae bacterium]